MAGIVVVRMLELISAATLSSSPSFDMSLVYLENLGCQAERSNLSVLNGRSVTKMTKIRCLERNCLFCGKLFQAPVKHINYGGGKYCSRRCSGRSANPVKIHEPNVVCAYCNKEFYITPSHLSKSKSGLYFCCRQHKDTASRIGGIEAIQPDHYGKADRMNYREIALREYPAICMRCKFDKVIVVHHKDRDRSNNELSNLEILCPNCHALEHLDKMIGLG